MLTTISEYAKNLQKMGMSNMDIHSHLNEVVTTSSVSKWLSNKVEYPNLTAALEIYKVDKIAIMPYDAEALENILESQK